MGVDARDHFNRQIQRVIDRLDGIHEAVDALDTREETIRRAVVLDPTNTEKDLIQTRPGWLAQISRVTIVSDGSADVELFAGGRADANLVFRSSNAAAVRRVDDVGGTAVGVPSRGRLTAALTGGASTQVTVAVQGVLIKTESP